MVRDLERLYQRAIPSGLSELMEHGIPMDRFPLYTHQEEALLSSFGEASNLLVASGTGSGKTEAFVLPILARILKEAYGWARPQGYGSIGYYDPHERKWRHARRHETWEAGLRAIILYPMNALVIDQMSRLRRILALNGSSDWQRRHLSGNLIHFGMYTSLTLPTRGRTVRQSANNSKSTCNTWRKNGTVSPLNCARQVIGLWSAVPKCYAGGTCKVPLPTSW